METWWIDGSKNRETCLCTTTRDDDMDSDTVAETDMSLISRSFLHRVNDRVRKIQDQSSKDATQDSNKHSLLWRIFISSTLEASVFMGKNSLEIFTFHQKYRKRSHNETDVRHIWKVDSRTIRWDQWIQLTGVILHGNIYLWWWRSQSLAREGLRIFRFCVMPWKDEREPTINYCLDKLMWFKSSSQYKFELDIFPGFTTLQLCYKVQDFLSKMSVEPEDFTGRIIFMSMFNDISWGSQDNEQECELSAKLVSIYAKRFSPGRWSFLGPGSEKKWCSTHESKPQGEWSRVAELMMSKFGESGHPVFRSTSPLSRGVPKSKGGGKLSIHFCADEGTIETVFRTIISVNQLSIYGAVPDLCEEYKSCHVRTGRPVFYDNLTHCLCRKDRSYTFDRWSCSRRSIAKVPRTSGQAVVISLSLWWDSQRMRCSFTTTVERKVCLGCERDILQHCAECEIVCGVLETLCYIAFEYDTELTSTREKNIATLLRLWQFPLHHRPMNFSLP